MNVKMLLRASVFLLMLFVVLYTGMYNKHAIDFHFPLLLAKKASQPAALIFFAVFALGVLAGVALKAGGESDTGKKRV